MKAQGFSRCTSPLEVRLARAFVSLTSEWEWRRPGDDAILIGRWPGWGIGLLAEVTIPLKLLGVGPGNYRCDFVLMPGSSLTEAPAWMVAVEADGHGYHERTPKQAKHDRSRDRAFTAIGVRVLRFTGSEINRDADACAREALLLATDLQRPILDDMFQAELLAVAREKGLL